MNPAALPVHRQCSNRSTQSGTASERGNCLTRPRSAPRGARGCRPVISQLCAGAGFVTGCQTFGFGGQTVVLGGQTVVLGGQTVVLGGQTRGCVREPAQGALSGNCGLGNPATPSGP